jgi:DNA-binding MarR family transcriptional regulator
LKSRGLKVLPHDPEKTGVTARETLKSKVGYLLNQTAMIIRVKTAEQLAPLSLGPRESGVLIFIADTGEIVQQELSERMNIDRTTTMQIVSRLVEAGILMRRTHPEDGRAYLVSITPEGMKLKKDAEKVIDRVQKEVLSSLTASEKKALSDLLVKILENNTK